MSDARTTGLSATDAVLGLVVERPDHGFSLERRLQVRFGSAQFGHSTAYSAVRRLEKDGYVRAAAGGQDGGVVIFEATAKGVERFRDWVLAPAGALVLREDLHARIALCEPRDLPRLIDIVYAEECACVAELDRISEEMVAGQAGGGAAPLAEREWSELMDNAVIHGQVAHWGGRISQLTELRSYLEELSGEAERRAVEEHWPGLLQRRRAG
jgi:DNA-binding PadR family transcriptional regulator